jgi:excisionase family DNA binding protein
MPAMAGKKTPKEPYRGVLARGMPSRSVRPNKILEATEYDYLLTPLEVAKIFAVNVKTVGRWARAGHLPYLTTLGGHRRFRQSDIDRLLVQRDPELIGHHRPLRGPAL